MAAKRLKLAERAIEKTIAYLILFGASLAEFWVLMVAFFYAWFTIGAGGLTLIFLRGVFIESIPFLISIAKPSVDYINFFLIAFGIVENGAILVIDAVIDIGSIFDPRLKPITPRKFAQITYQEYITDLKIIGTECVPIDSTYAIAGQFVPTYLSDTSCPIFRALWPLPGNISQTLYQPFEGYVADPTPYPGNNCDYNNTVKNGLLCAGVGIGYPIMEIIFPMIIIGIFILSSGNIFFSLVAEILFVATDLILSIGDVFERISKTTERAIKFFF